MRTGIKVGDAMTTKPVTTSKETSIMDCARLMEKYDVGSIVIQDKDSLIGIVTEFDLTRKVLAKGVDSKTGVGDIMETVLVTIEPDRDLFEAIEAMRDNEIRHLPVVEDNKFIGLVTMKDVLKIAPGLFDVLVEKIRLREESRKPIKELIL